MTAAHVDPPAAREPFIDVLRGAAALAVLFHHTAGGEDAGVVPWAVALFKQVVSLGYLGVPVFFVVSGYCVGRSWQKLGDPRAFIRRRLLRILPPYYGGLLLVLVVVAATRLLTGVNDLHVQLPRSPGALLATITGMTSPASGVPTVNWVHWSLTYELAFYVALGLLLAFPRRHAWVVAFTAGCAAADFFGTARPGTPLFFCNYWPHFALGLGVAFHRANPAAARWAVGVALLHVACRVFRLGEGWGAQWTSGVSASDAISVATFLALVVARRRPVGTIGGRLAWVGGFSYSLYLVHVPLGGYFLCRHLPSPTLAHGAPFLAGVAIIVVSCVVFAWAFSRVAEAPFMSKPPAAARETPQPEPIVSVPQSHP